MLGFGGQTARNCGLELEQKCVLERHGIKILGSPIQATRESEDREAFVKKLTDIRVNVPRSVAATSVEQAFRAAQEIVYPVL